MHEYVFKMKKGDIEIELKSDDQKEYNFNFIC